MELFSNCCSTTLNELEVCTLNAPRCRHLLNCRTTVAIGLFTFKLERQQRLSPQFCTKIIRKISPKMDSFEDVEYLDETATEISIISIPEETIEESYFAAFDASTINNKIEGLYGKLSHPSPPIKFNKPSLNSSPVNDFYGIR